jgi:serine/threonine protein phosphatase PrpC
VAVVRLQDAAFTCWPLGGDPNVALFGVFDGHGDSGHRCAHFCMRRVCEFVEARAGELVTELAGSRGSSSQGSSAAGAVLTAAFLHADQQLGKATLKPNPRH